MQIEQVLANVAARKRAEDLIELIGEEAPRFWESLALLVESKLPAKPVEVDPNGPMTDDEAVRFSYKQFPRGQHEGECVGDVGDSYCVWWAEEDKFSIDMRRYVQSDWFWRTQDEPEDNEPVEE